MNTTRADIPDDLWVLLDTLLKNTNPDLSDVVRLWLIALIDELKKNKDFVVILDHLQNIKISMMINYPDTDQWEIKKSYMVEKKDMFPNFEIISIVLLIADYFIETGDESLKALISIIYCANHFLSYDEQLAMAFEIIKHQ